MKLVRKLLWTLLTLLFVVSFIMSGSFRARASVTTIYACNNVAACQTGSGGDQSHQVISNGNIGTPSQQVVGDSGGDLHSGFR